MRLARLIDFLGLQRSITGLLSMVILVGMGEHMAEQFLPLYLLALGGGFISVGFLKVSAHQHHKRLGWGRGSCGAELSEWPEEPIPC